jgi:hypothetical protein
LSIAEKSDAILQEMIAHHQIRKTLAVYCHGCDRGDAPRMSSVYGRQSWDDHGIFRGPGPEFTDFIMNLISGSGGSIGLSHLLGQSLITVDGDQAGAETSFLSTVSAKDGGGEPTVTLHGGRYVDRLRQEDGEWKIEKRTCTRDWSITLVVQRDDLSPEFVKGERSGADPSYAVLGLTHPGQA